MSFFIYSLYFIFLFLAVFIACSIAGCCAEKTEKKRWEKIMVTRGDAKYNPDSGEWEWIIK